MECEYTPGPWLAKREGNRYTVGTWVQQEGYEGFGVVTATVPATSPTGKADAMLIAAAPDLLAACCAGDIMALGPKLLEIAAEAIAKNGREGEYLATRLQLKAELERAAIDKALHEQESNDAA